MPVAPRSSDLHTTTPAPLMYVPVAPAPLMFVPCNVGAFHIYALSAESLCQRPIGLTSLHQRHHNDYARYICALIMPRGKIRRQDKSKFTLLEGQLVID